MNRRFFTRPANGLPITESAFDFRVLGFGDEDPAPRRTFPAHSYYHDRNTGRREVATRTHSAVWWGDGPLRYEPADPPDDFRALVKQVRALNS